MFDPYAVSLAQIKAENTDSVEYLKNGKLCYCLKERSLNIVELQCEKCYRWCHQSCISIPLPKMIQFLTCYNFICKDCHPMHHEAFAKRTTTKSFAQICQTALANLFFLHRTERLEFSRDREIIPFIDENWDALTHNHKRLKQTWHQTVTKTLLKDSELFIWNQDQDDMKFALRYRDLEKIGPNYDSPKGVNTSLWNKIENSLQQQAGARSSRGGKKRVNNDNSLDLVNNFSKRQKSELTQPKLPPSGFPAEFPFNKESWRYFLAEPDLNAPCRQEFEELQDRIQIPNFLFRRLLPETCCLSMHDRAPQLKISEDRKFITGEKGYSTVRGNVGVTHGTWFFEVKIVEKPDNAACRLGWGQELANLQAPLGYDKYGYSWRSRKGTKFHQSKGAHFTEEGYGLGDVIGCLIELPNIYPGPMFSKYENSPYLPKTCKDKPLIKFKSYHYFEEKDEPAKMASELVQLYGAKISYFKNGQPAGVAFEDIFHGVYYPAASMYKSITLAFNFGPTFECPISHRTKIKPMSDAVVQNQVDQTMADILYMVEHEDELKLQ